MCPRHGLWVPVCQLSHTCLHSTTAVILFGTCSKDKEPLRSVAWIKATSSPALGQVDAFIVRPPVPPVHLLHVKAHHLQWQCIVLHCIVVTPDQLALPYACPPCSQTSYPQDLDEMMKKCSKCGMPTGRHLQPLQIDWYLESLCRTEANVHVL